MDTGTRAPWTRGPVHDLSKHGKLEKQLVSVFLHGVILFPSANCLLIRGTQCLTDASLPPSPPPLPMLSQVSFLMECNTSDSPSPNSFARSPSLPIRIPSVFAELNYTLGPRGLQVLCFFFIGRVRPRGRASSRGYYRTQNGYSIDSQNGTIM